MKRTSELQVNKANSSETEAAFLDLHLTISDGFVSSKIYDKRDDFDFVNFPFLDVDIPSATSYRVYISQLIMFASITETSPYSFGNFRKLSLYNYFIPI